MLGYGVSIFLFLGWKVFLGIDMTKCSESRVSGRQLLTPARVISMFYRVVASCPHVASSFMVDIFHQARLYTID